MAVLKGQVSISHYLGRCCEDLFSHADDILSCDHIVCCGHCITRHAAHDPCNDDNCTCDPCNCTQCTTTTHSRGKPQATTAGRLSEPTANCMHPTFDISQTNIKAASREHHTTFSPASRPETELGQLPLPKKTTMQVVLRSLEASASATAASQSSRLPARNTIDPHK